MKKIYQIVFALLFLFFIIGQESLVFGQMDLQTALSGKLVCLQSMATSTKADSTNQTVKDTTKTTRIVMRCYSSYTPTKEPLYIIDGIPLSENDSTFKNLSPEDIESISVMKGVSATALYGSRGANGVILIILKKKEIKEEKTEKPVEEVEINVFPNPTTEFVNIALNLKEKSEVEIKIYNLQTLESYEINKEMYEAGEQQINWKVNSLANGTYNIKIKIGKQIITKKLVIQK